MADTLFDLVNDFIRTRVHSGPATVYDYVSAYSRLLSMKPEMVMLLLTDRQEQEEYTRLCNSAREFGLDVENMRQYAPLLLNADPGSYDLETAVEDVRRKSGGDDNYVSANLLFRKLAAENEFICKLFRPGVPIEEIMEYQKAHAPAPKKAPAPPSETSEALPAAKSQPEIDASAIFGSAQPEEAAVPETPQNFSELAQRSHQLYETLRQYVIGQDEAVRIFVQGYFQSELRLDGKKHQGPKATFLFAGPPGVGKTFLATTAADQLGLPTKRFDMSEYAGDGDLKELIGYDPNYKEAKPGQLTGFVKKHPKSVIIFDEIEKAHLTVIHTFLQILDAGHAQDQNTSEKVSFKECTLIFTTNVGKKLYADTETNLSMLSQQVILNALGEETNPRTNEPMFPAAIISRFATGNVVMFNHLRGRSLLEIVRRNFDSHAAAFQKCYHCAINLDPLIAPMFLFHMSSNLDARIISSQSRSIIGRELYEFSRTSNGRIDYDKLSSISFRVRMPESDPEIRPLFAKETTDEILLLVDPETAALLAPLPANIKTAGCADEAYTLAEQQDFNLILIDPLFGSKGDTSAVFSMEDFDTEGVRAIHRLISSPADHPLYILDRAGNMSDADRGTFCQMGVRGVLVLGDRKQAEFCAEIDETLNELYLQEQLTGLSSRGRVLNYNTAQSCSEDGTEAVIEFYDFKVEIAVDADSKDSIMSAAERPDVRFADIIGAENAKKELEYFIGYLKHPKDYMRRGQKPPKGILLYGPPGTGKTMLAKAMAGESGVTFLPFAATDFMSKWVGEGENRIREAFTTAKRYAPSVIFIDEIDAIAKERNRGSADYTETLLNALLTEMDGFVFDPKRPVFVIAATNFPLDKDSANGGVVIDPALIRRFDNKILVDLPNKDERLAFLRLKLKGYTIEESVLNNIADRTTGESLAHLNNIVSLAIRNAEKSGKELDGALLLAALEEYFYGEEHTWNQEYYASVAHHEAGHAYICWLSGEKPSFLTIVSRGNFGGYMQHENSEKTPNYTKEQLLWKIRTALAGRASEIVFYGTEAGTNTGISSDLQQATNIALAMLCRYGMSGTSLLSLSPETMLKLPSGTATLQEADALLQREMANTMRLVTEGRDKIERLTQELLAKNQLVTEEILAILEK